MMNNSMQSLSKSNELFTKHLLNDKTYDSFVKKLHKEIQETRNFLLKVSGQQELKEHDPINSRSIEIREKLVLPLIVI